MGAERWAFLSLLKLVAVEKLRERRRFFAAFWEESRGKPGEFGNKEKPNTLSQPRAQPDALRAVSCLRARRCVAC